MDVMLRQSSCQPDSCASAALKFAWPLRVAAAHFRFANDWRKPNGSGKREAFGESRTSSYKSGWLAPAKLDKTCEASKAELVSAAVVVATLFWIHFARWQFRRRGGQFVRSVWRRLAGSGGGGGGGRGDAVAARNKCLLRVAWLAPSLRNRACRVSARSATTAAPAAQKSGGGCVAQHKSADSPVALAVAGKKWPPPFGRRAHVNYCERQLELALPWRRRSLQLEVRKHTHTHTHTHINFNFNFSSDFAPHHQPVVGWLARVAQ